MKKFRTYTFWVALISAIILAIQELCKLFGWVVETNQMEKVMLSVCGIFVVLGIITKSTAEKNSDILENLEENSKIVEKSKTANDAKTEKSKTANDAKTEKPESVNTTFKNSKDEN